MRENKRKCKLLLSGGGTKCCYQITMLRNIVNSKNYIENYNLTEIYGTSFGSLTGLCLCLKKYDELIEFFLTLTKSSLIPWFDLWGMDKYIRKIPIIGQILGIFIDMIWIMVSLSKKSLYNPIIGMKFLESLEIDKEENRKKLTNYYCCVYNVTRGYTQYINGLHPQIKEYIIASSSIWIIFPPVQIQMLSTECVCGKKCNCDKKSQYCTCTDPKHRYNEFIDGGILRPIPQLITPLKRYSDRGSQFTIDDKTVDDIFIFTTNGIPNIINPMFKNRDTGLHLFEYLDRIIGYMIDKNYAIDFKNVVDIINGYRLYDNIKVVEYIPIINDLTNVNHEIIKKMLREGEHMSEDFIQTILKKQPLPP